MYKRALLYSSVPLSPKRLRQLKSNEQKVFSLLFYPHFLKESTRKCNDDVLNGKKRKEKAKCNDDVPLIS